MLYCFFDTVDFKNVFYARIVVSTHPTKKYRGVIKNQIAHYPPPQYAEDTALCSASTSSEFGLIQKYKAITWKAAIRVYLTISWAMKDFCLSQGWATHPGMLVTGQAA